MNHQTTSFSVYRQLGRTGIEVSSVGIGTWAMGAEWGTQEDRESIATLHRALVGSSIPPKPTGMAVVSS